MFVFGHSLYQHMELGLGVELRFGPGLEQICYVIPTTADVL